MSYAEKCYERSLKLREVADELLDKAGGLDSQFELAKTYQYQGDYHDTVFCSKCNTGYREVYDGADIPIKRDAICESCRMTPEEKEEKRLKAAEKERQLDLAQLSRLHAKLGMQPLE